MTHVLIIGGGVAGAVTAMALKKAGFTPVIHEAYATGADDIGAFLTIMNNGIDALRAIGAHQPVIDNSFPADHIEFLDRRGVQVGCQVIGDGADINGPRTLTRATLYRALHDEAERRGIPLVHGKRLTRAENTAGGGVVAFFDDGTHAEGDLLVGADGIHSTTRSIIDPTAPGPRHTGLTIAYGYARDSALPVAQNCYRMIEGSRAFFGYTTAPDGETWWFARLPADEPTRLVEAFAHDDTPAADIIAATGGNVFLTDAYDVPSTPMWHDRSMVLVGDAAHAASPAAGQGASMAIEDGVVLAQCLRDVPDPAQAFHIYEQKRRSRVERLVTVSAAQGTKSTREESREWLYRHHLDWDAPTSSSERSSRPVG